MVSGCHTHKTVTSEPGQIERGDGRKFSKPVDEVMFSFERHSSKMINIGKKETEEEYVSKININNKIDSYDIIRKVGTLLTLLNRALGI